MFYPLDANLRDACGALDGKPSAIELCDRDGHTLISFKIAKTALPFRRKKFRLDGGPLHTFADRSGIFEFARWRDSAGLIRIGDIDRRFFHLNDLRVTTGGTATLRKVELIPDPELAQNQTPRRNPDSKKCPK